MKFMDFHLCSNSVGKSQDSGIQVPSFVPAYFCPQVTGLARGAEQALPAAVDALARKVAAEERDVLRVSRGPAWLPRLVVIWYVWYPFSIVGTS